LGSELARVFRKELTANGPGCRKKRDDTRIKLRAYHVVGCDASGFFGDWWLAGSYFEFATATCKFTDSFRRVIGYGAEIVVFIVHDVTPDRTNGCSFASTHNYVVIEAKPTDQAFVAAHEMGHACWLPHVSDPADLMNPVTPSANPTLTDLQISVIRWSKHCVYI
jgi:hypothetical protein